MFGPIALPKHGTVSRCHSSKSRHRVPQAHRYKNSHGVCPFVIQLEIHQHPLPLATYHGANGLQPCKFPTIVYLSPPSHKSKSDLYSSDKPQSPRYWQHQAIIATPTPKDDILRAPRYHDLSCDRLTQKYLVQSKHLVPRSDVSKHGTSVSEGQQNSCLQGGVNNVFGGSGPQRCQGLYKSRLQKAHLDAGSSKPCGKDDPKSRTRARDRDQGQGTKPDGCQPPRAPPMRTVPLPKRQEDDEYISYYGLGLAPGWLMGTVQVDNVPKVLGRLDMALPVPFA
ncbi:hypothetical protein F5888DRAFT_1657095 [Russula emetica]|nr:hypothetical protein F5888DRAFT_1657095 [Russula emetica]